MSAKTSVPSKQRVRASGVSRSQSTAIRGTNGRNGSVAASKRVNGESLTVAAA